MEIKFYFNEMAQRYEIYFYDIVDGKLFPYHMVGREMVRGDAQEVNSIIPPTISMEINQFNQFVRLIKKSF